MIGSIYHKKKKRISESNLKIIKINRKTSKQTKIYYIRKKNNFYN